MRAYFIERILTAGRTRPMSPQWLTHERRLLALITRVDHLFPSSPMVDVKSTTS